MTVNRSSRTTGTTATKSPSASTGSSACPSPTETAAHPGPVAPAAPRKPVPVPDAPPASGPGPAITRWLGAFAASLVGDQMWFLALAWSAAETAGPTGAGIVVTLGTVPRALLMLLGGSIADRFGARRVVIGSVLVRFAVMAFAAAAVALAAPGVALLAAIALVFGAVDALFMPAIGALPPTLTMPEHYARVQGLRSLMTRLSAIAGAPAAGLVLANGGVAAAFAASAGLFAFSFLLLWRLRPVPAAVAAADAKDGGVPPGDGSIREGLRYVRSVPLLTWVIAVGIISELGFSAPMNLGLVLLSGDRGWGPGGVGLMLGAWGAGAVATGLVLSVRGHVPHAGRVMTAALGLGAVGMGVMGLAPTLPVAMAGAAVLGLGSGFWGGLSAALIQTTAARSMLGRVVALQMLGAVGLVPVTYPLAGLLSDTAGPAALFAVGTGLQALACAVALCCAPLRTALLERPGRAERAS
ncbi:MFS transporter [Yinghuangia soli]|uniref:MFS transporter n=1 Tax=Yinghuangia soli TaxID=2908204 RepID=A0AA41Q325_9ACTN|nr:MFS transporter [Yinghuangia soli]MCF2530411.1 MFS transporter [Yinghuangia soli]